MDSMLSTLAAATFPLSTPCEHVGRYPCSMNQEGEILMNRAAGDHGVAYGAGSRMVRVTADGDRIVIATHEAGVDGALQWEVARP